MSTFICTKMWSPRGISIIANTSNRLWSTTSWSISNVQLQLSDQSLRAHKFQPIRNISLSTTRYKDVYKRTKPHLNIGKYLNNKTDNN